LLERHPGPSDSPRRFEVALHYRVLSARYSTSPLSLHLDHNCADVPLILSWRWWTAGPVAYTSDRWL